MVKKVWLFATVFLSIALMINSVYGYQMDYFLSNTSANSKTLAPSFFSNLNCQVQMTPYASFNSTSFPYSAIIDYFSPNATQIATSPQTFTTNKTAFNFGLVTTTTKLNNVYEARYDLIDTATTSRIIFPHTKYVCNGNNLLDFDFKNDSRGFETNVYGATGNTGFLSCVSNQQTFLNSSNFNFNTPTHEFLILFRNNTAATIDENTFYCGAIYLPFNTTNGQFSYDIDFSVIQKTSAISISELVRLYAFDNSGTLTALCSGS